MEDFTFKLSVMIIGIMGMAAIFASIFNNDWYFRRAKVKFIEKLIHRIGVRIVFFIVGCLLVFIAYFLITF